MKKEAYQKEILERMNLDGTAMCEICGEKSMILHAFVDHDQGKVGIICHGCYLKKLSAEEN